jgi:hypothetical protein
MGTAQLLPLSLRKSTTAPSCVSHISFADCLLAESFDYYLATDKSLQCAPEILRGIKSK